ncbi:MAG: hypothetical protein ACREJV_03135, partial [Candidatus Rokuibacteriota bacterium]
SRASRTWVPPGHPGLMSAQIRDLDQARPEEVRRSDAARRARTVSMASIVARMTRAPYDPDA